MNENKTYQVIAAKLEQLPVPDMADMIWARIEAQLDIDLPPDNGNNDPGPAPTPKPVGRRIAMGAAAIAILIVIFQLNKNRKEDLNSIPFIPVQKNTRSVTPDSAFGFTKPLSERTTINGNQPPPPPGELLTTPVVKTDSNIVTIAESGATVKVPDSAINTLPLVIPPVVLKPAGDTTPVKKRRGVPISESDYRIVPKKDS